MLICTLRRIGLGFLLGILAPGALALDSAQVEREIAAFLSQQTQGLPGETSFRIGTIPGLASLDACQQVVVEAQPGARSYGRSSIRLRCIAGDNWVRLVQVQIQVIANYLVSARPLTAGIPLMAADLTTQRGDLGELPAGIMTDLSLAIGRVPRVHLPAGQALRGDLLKEQRVVANGQLVKVISRGQGFEVSTQGTAMNPANAGEAVRVKLESGKVVSGRALQDGNGETIN